MCECIKRLESDGYVEREVSYEDHDFVEPLRPPCSIHASTPV